MPRDVHDLEEVSDRSLLATWDKPAFSQGPYTEGVPWLRSRPEKGEHVDFLLSPDFEHLGPVLAKKRSLPAYSEMPIRWRVKHRGTSGV
jgi:hypothetical protein